MKIALQFAMPSELHALPGARELAPLETVSGVPIFELSLIHISEPTRH